MTHPRLRLAVALVVAVAAGGVGCGSCRKGGGNRGSEAVLRRLPRTSDAVVLVPALGAVADKLLLVEQLKAANFLAQLQGFDTARAYVAAVMGQLGVDLRSREKMEEAGLDPSGAAGASISAS